MFGGLSAPAFIGWYSVEKISGKVTTDRHSIFNVYRFAPLGFLFLHGMALFVTYNIELEIMICRHASALLEAKSKTE